LSILSTKYLLKNHFRIEKHVLHNLYDRENVFA